MNSVIGTISIVQEGRFRLIDRSGRPWHFILSADADIEPQDLPPLMARNLPVRVAWTRAPGVVAGHARQVTIEGGFDHEP